MKQQRIAFVLAATNQGTMILNRLDAQTGPDGVTYGVGIETLEHGTFEGGMSASMVQLLRARHQSIGGGVVALDCGANIGTLTVEWARAMHGWGQVIAIEAQERIFYALAGNIALNNCFNARAFNVAVGAQESSIRTWLPDYTIPANFGGLELRDDGPREDVGQRPGSGQGSFTQIRCVTLDSLGLERVDFIKIDVEGMEMDVLRGAKNCLAQRPILCVEYIKTGWDNLASFLGDIGYQCRVLGRDMLAIHPEDPVHQVMTIKARPC